MGEEGRKGEREREGRREGGRESGGRDEEGRDSRVAGRERGGGGRKKWRRYSML